MAIRHNTLISSSVIMIIDEERRILMLKNNEKKKQAGIWVFPGGKCDWLEDRGRYETYAEAVVRELLEETGLTTVLFNETPYLISYAGVLVKVFSASADDLLSSEVILSSEHTEFRWVDISNPGDIVMAPGATKLIKLLNYLS